jgi:hypothetical protein
MKALLITLLLLFIIISPSFAAPSTATVYVNRQKIVYTAFTNIGVINFEILWDPEQNRLVPGNARNTEFNPRPDGTTQVNIRSRRTRRWDFTENPPTSQATYIGATFNLPHVYYQGQAYPLPRGSLNPGIQILSPDIFNLRYITISRKARGGPRGRYEHPLAINYIFRTVMRPGEGLDQRTEQTLRSQGIDAILQRAPALALGRCHQPLPQLDPGIWIHLFSNTMDRYRVGDLGCEPAPADPANSNSFPNPNDGCRPTSCSYPRGPDDQDDPGAQREGKRQCYFDLNSIPEDQGEAGGSYQGANSGGINFNNWPGNQVKVDWLAYLFGAREDNFAVPDTVDHGSDALYFIDRFLSGYVFFALWEHFTTPTSEEIPGLKTLRLMICYEVVRRGSAGIHDEFR